jgi:hypothetical protein
MASEKTRVTRRGAPIGRPRSTAGGKRIPITVRLLPSTDKALTAAIKETGSRPQDIVEEAIIRYLNDELGIEVQL